jgi:putative tryptophan/tyrosine transport system substrate-binding protein
MDRRTFVAAAAALPFAAFAQSERPRISFVSTTSPNTYGHLVEEFRLGLREHGYVEGSNLSLDLWWAHNRLERVPALVAELLTTKPAVIVTHGSFTLSALQKATTLPIVFTSAGDPVGQGFVKTFRQPGGNITGVAFNDEINSKVYELAKIVMPQATRMATLINPDNPGKRHRLRVLPANAKALKFDSLVVNARSLEDLEPAFVEAVGARMHAMIVSSLAPFPGLRADIALLQFKYRLPAFFSMREGTEAGGLASYSFPTEESFRRAAAIVYQILKGRSPADIPVEIPTKYEIAINIKTAKALGLKVPEAALVRAHKVIH